MKVLHPFRGLDYEIIVMIVPLYCIIQIKLH
jgi:hypothetical protein